MKKQFKSIKLHAATLWRVEQCNSVLEDLTGQGYQVTLRQLYYQLVKDNIIQNSKQEYKKLVSLMTKARYAGLVNWDHLYDFTRSVKSYYKNVDPEEAIESAASCYNIDLWADQEYYVEVWVEKDALQDVISKPASRFQVNYFSCRGYVSASSMYEAHRRLAAKARSGRQPVIIHVGDHDPSGVQMTSDIRDRHNKLFGGEVKIDRIALNLDQVRERQLPPNPAKQTDSRYKAYCAEFKVDDSWELDALAPRELDEMIEKRIKHYMDFDKYNSKVEKKHNDIHFLNQFSANYDLLTKVIENVGEVEDFVNTL